MQFEIRTITPADAKLLLASNAGNRRLNQTHVAFFEAQLKRNEMQLTHQGIAISSSGRLLDGQHRLTAIVNTGISSDMLVVTGMADESFSVLDTGSTRSAGDVLSITGAENTTTAAAAIRLFILYDNAPHMYWSGHLIAKLISSFAIKNEYDSNQLSWAKACNIGSSNALAKVIIPGPSACLAYLAIKNANYSFDYVNRFFAKLRAGSDLSAGDPILAYRNRILTMQTGSWGQTRLADYIKLFNAYSCGKKLKIFKTQSFPPMPSLIHASESIREDAAA